MYKYSSPASRELQFVRQRSTSKLSHSSQESCLTKSLHSYFDIQELLIQIRELIYQCDQTMKAVTVGYFQLQHSISAAAPVQFQTLCESSRLYEPGSSLTEFVKRLPSPPSGQPGQPTYKFHPYNESSTQQQPNTNQSTSSIQKGKLSLTTKIASDSDSLPDSGEETRQEEDNLLLTVMGHHGGHSTGGAVSSGDELETDIDVSGKFLIPSSLP